jgi:hypothetical protein
MPAIGAILIGLEAILIDRTSGKDALIEAANKINER